MKIIYLPKEQVYTGNLILVNQDHPYQEHDLSCLCPVTEDSPVLMDRRAVVLLTNLMRDIHGWRELTPVSGYRSNKEQQELFSTSLADNGAEFTTQYVASPGHSEHQTGLAIDLGLKQPEIDFIRPDFPDTGTCLLFKEKASHYGFILRYPSQKEQITGIAYEPWHYRFVGAPHAAIMEEKGLVLEEYIDFVKDYPYGQSAYCYEQRGLQFMISYLPAKKEQTTELTLHGDLPYSISGNNIDGFIITEWETNHAGECKR